MSIITLILNKNRSQPKHEREINTHRNTDAEQDSMRQQYIDNITDNSLPEMYR